jgi:hypothetical protein
MRAKMGEVVLALVLFFLGVLTIVARMAYLAIKSSQRIFVTSQGITLRFSPGIIYNTKVINDYLDSFFQVYGKAYDQKRMNEVLGSVTVDVEDGKIHSAKRSGKEQEYMGLTYSETYIKIASLTKTFKIRETAMTWELHNILIWNFKGYETALTEGDFQNACLFMREETARKLIEDRKHIDDCYREALNGL